LNGDEVSKILLGQGWVKVRENAKGDEEYLGELRKLEGEAKGSGKGIWQQSTNTSTSSMQPPSFIRDIQVFEYLSIHC